MLERKPANRPGWVRVRFVCPGNLWVDQLSLIGDFNGWNPNAHPVGDTSPRGDRAITLELPGGEIYRFAYLADGVRCTEPDADGFVSDAQGGPASILDTSVAELDRDSSGAALGESRNADKTAG